MLIGIAILSREPASVDGNRVAAGVGLAVFAAVAFGAFFVGIDAAADESVPWAVVAVRSTSVAFAIAWLVGVRRVAPRPARAPAHAARDRRLRHRANVFFAEASTESAIGIVAVLSALYPVVTVALARIVLHEQLTVGRRAGGLIALAGAALVAAG